VTLVHSLVPFVCAIVLFFCGVYYDMSFPGYLALCMRSCQRLLLRDVVLRWPRLEVARVASLRAVHRPLVC
jgi:hypothetical protein